MAELRRQFFAMGFHEVVSYINSGNIVFSSTDTPDARVIQATVEAYFGFRIDMLVLTAERIATVARAIPGDWHNDTEQKTDVLYLFDDIDSPDIMNRIGYRPEFETIIYTSGALIAHVTRENQSKSSLMQLVGTPLYKRMTVRNINTARKLAMLTED